MTGGRTRRRTRRQSGGDVPHLSKEEIEELSATLAEKEPTLTVEQIDFFIKVIPRLIEVLEKSNLDTFITELVEHKEYELLLPELLPGKPDIVAQIIKDKRNSVYIANSTYRAKGYKNKRTTMKNILNSGQKQEHVINAAVKERHATYIKLIRPNLEGVLEDARIPATSYHETIQTCKAVLDELRKIRERPQQGGAYEADSINGILGQYIKNRRTIDPNTGKLLSRIYGITLITGRTLFAVGVVPYYGSIGFIIHAGITAVVFVAEIVAIVTGVGAALYLYIKGQGGTIFGTSTGLPDAPKKVETALEKQRRNENEETRAKKNIYDRYDFVTTRVRQGMRIYNPFLKAHVPFVLLPKPSAVKYALSFIFTQSPSYEPYGDEVNRIWEDKEFDKAIDTIYLRKMNSGTDDMFGDLNANYGFIGNLFVGKGVATIPADMLKANKNKTIIDEKGLPWTYDQQKDGFVVLGGTADKTKRSWGNFMKMRGVTALFRGNIGARSVEHPAYDLKNKKGFRNAVYLAARYFLKAYGANEKPPGMSTSSVTTVNPMQQQVQPDPRLQEEKRQANAAARVRAEAQRQRQQREAAPPPPPPPPQPAKPQDLMGWTKETSNNRTYYKCNLTGVMQWKPPAYETPCDLLGWTKEKANDGAIYYECDATGVTQWDPPTRKQTCVKQPPKQTQAPIPAGWVTLYDNNKPYYQCGHWQVTQWDLPTEACTPLPAGWEAKLDDQNDPIYICPGRTMVRPTDIRPLKPC